MTTKTAMTHRQFCFNLILPVLIGALFSLTWYSLPSMGLLVLFPAAWLIWKTRLQSSLFIVSFWCFTDWEIIPDTAHFFSNEPFSLSIGVAIWLAQAILYSAPWILFYSKDKNWLNLSLRTLSLLIILTLPPLGYFFWLNPLASSGVLFPGLGWPGLCLTIILMLLFVITPNIKNKIVGITPISILLVTAILANLAYLPPSAPKDWVAINTKLGGTPANLFEIPARESKLISLAQQALDQNYKVIIFPENIALDWLPGTQFQWQGLNQEANNKNATIVVGAQEDLKNGSSNNLLIVLGQGNGQIYSARQPMPIGLWQPWKSETDNRHWNLPGKFLLQGQETGYLICYEQIVPWPILSLFLQAPYPTVIISVANQWFSMPSGYLKQSNHMRAFARLFGVATMTAVNS